MCGYEWKWCLICNCYRMQKSTTGGWYCDDCGSSISIISNSDATSGEHIIAIKRADYKTTSSV